MAMLDPDSRHPLYLQLVRVLRHQISTGTYMSGDRLPPETELATQFSISRGTVRQAMDVLVNQGLLERVAGKGTFVTAPEQRPRSQLIGIVVPYLLDSLTSAILQGAESVLRRRGYSLIFCHSEGNLDLERHQIERLQREGVCGLLLFPLATAAESVMLKQLLPNDFPLVLIDRRIPDLQAASVFIDNFGGAYRTVEHLISLGHRRIVCVSLPDQPSSIVERTQGYEQAMRDAGILPLASMPLALHKDRPPDNGIPTYADDEMAPITKLLSIEEPPTALFCINDFVALGVMQRVLAHGLSIPHDIAIAGFDDIAIAPHM
ncbi:MAG: GntR family transcriptional regulator, partial [Chloroflexota bacterium]